MSELHAVRAAGCRPYDRREQAPALPRSDVGIGPYILCFYKPQNIIYTYYNIPPGKIQERRSRGCPAVPPLVFGLIPP